MKLQALLLVTFSTFLMAIKTTQPIPSFFKLVGTYKYNTTDNGKFTLKRYYSSHRITHKWIDAYTMCKSVGMRMALIESKDELNKLARMGTDNVKLFKEETFVDGYNLESMANIENKKDEPCYSLQKRPRETVKIRSAICYRDLKQFLCEQVEVAEEYHPSAEKFDVKPTFFEYIGNYWNRKYYAVFDLKANSNEATKICQGFGMQVALPKFQEEYENLKKLLLAFGGRWNAVWIAGYRSVDNESEWVTLNGKLNYKINWQRDEPNNDRRNENCIELKNNKAVAEMNDLPCSLERQLVCEYDESITVVHAPSQIDYKLLKPLTSYTIKSTKKELFVSRFDVDWMSAILICRNSGMELYTPHSTTDDQTLRQKLIEIPDASNSSYHVGITSMGSSNTLYSVHDGEVLDINLAPSHTNSNGCLQLIKSNGTYAYDASIWGSKLNHFICQKVAEVTEDEITEDSTKSSADDSVGLRSIQSSYILRRLSN